MSIITPHMVAAGVEKFKAIAMHPARDNMMVSEIVMQIYEAMEGAKARRLEDKQLGGSLRK